MALKRRIYVQQPRFRATLFGLPKRVGTAWNDTQSILHQKQRTTECNGELHKRDSQTDSRGRCVSDQIFDMGKCALGLAAKEEDYLEMKFGVIVGKRIG